MKNLDSFRETNPTNRRSFLKSAGGTTAAVAAFSLAPSVLRAADSDDSPEPAVVDTPQQIFTAALIAEDLATTFYYNVLVGRVVQDVNLAGPGGTATHVSPSGSVSNVGYIRAALTEEISHANLFRTLLGEKSYATDPYQEFYFDDATFTNFNEFIATVQALENAFIGAYLAAIQEFSLLASHGEVLTFGGQKFKPSDFAYFAKVSASIMGIECEHRALGRAISPTLIPANQLNYEQTDGIKTVFNGPKSAAAALTPFLTAGHDKLGYMLDEALKNAGKVGLPTVGTIPAQ